jgi:membrane protein
MMQTLLQDFFRFLQTVRAAIVFLWHRMVALRLPQLAGSLSYTTVLSMVPLLVIVLSILTVLPQFQGFQKEIQDFMTENLMPARMSKTVMQQITIFTQSSARLSLVGGAFLIFSSLTTMAIIDRAFDDIWQIKKRATFRANVAIYWAVLTLGPFVFGGALLLINWLVRSLSAFAFVSSFLGVVLPFILSTVIFAALYVFVPKRRVRWHDALVGGAIAAVIFSVLTHTFSAVFKSFSGYAVLYGAFSIIPAFFLWLYVFWWGVLFGAGITANLPILKYERWRKETRVGYRLSEALMLLYQLYLVRKSPTRMMAWDALQAKMKMNSEELGFIVEHLQKFNWIAKVQRADGGYGWALIADTDEVSLADVYDAFVFDTRYYSEQAMQHHLPWAKYLAQLQNTPAHDVRLSELFSASS